MPRSLRSGKIQDMVRIMESPEFFGIQHDMRKSLVAEHIKELLGRIGLLDPASERMFMEWVREYPCTIEIIGPRLTDEKELRFRRKVASDIHGSLVLVQCSAREVAGGFPFEGDVHRRKHCVV